MTILECIECGSTPVEFNGLCASCSAQKRKEERQAKKSKVAKPVNKVSEKKAAELKEYAKLKKEFLNHKMKCELVLPGCFVSSYEVHHTSLSEKNFLNTDTWMAICRSCHKKVETEMSAEERRQKNLLTD